MLRSEYVEEPLLGKVTKRSKNLFLSVVAIGTIFFLISVLKYPDLIIPRNDIEYNPSWSINTSISSVTSPFPIANQTDSISFDDRYAIKTQGCIIPAMQPISPEIKDLVYWPPNLKPCPNTNYSLLEQNGTHIWVNNDKRILDHYKIENSENISCCYSSFYRPDYIENIYHKNIDDRIIYNDCVWFNSTVTVKDEFVRVRCSYKKKDIYDQYFLFVPFKTRKINDEDEDTTKKPDQGGYNVLLIGIDAVSRLNFHRTMQKTASFMKSRGSVEFMGYNKVGDNSFPNIIPMLTGYRHTDLKEICHPIHYTTFDDCPFLWHLYQDAGFYTAFGEDSSYLGTFNYLQKGFRKTPTDYYLHPFIHEAEKHVGTHQDYNAKLCMNEHFFYQVLLDYIQSMTEVLADSKLFGFFWETTISHDDVNYPMGMDDSYVKFFKQLESSKYLEKTIVFLISDHGIRWGAIRRTKQGYFEERLPLLNVLLPESFRKKYSEAYSNLIYNSRQLTTPFDLHETLLDLVDLKNIENENIWKNSKRVRQNVKGVSLFQKIHQNRTCESAGIDEHWCTCHDNVQISSQSVEAMSVAGNLTMIINSLLKPYSKCAKLVLDKVLRASEIKGNASDVKDNSKDYTVVIRVKPSGALFEASLHKNEDKWFLTGSISRLNLYGNQSFCVDDSLIKLYCYCIV